MLGLPWSGRGAVWAAARERSLPQGTRAATVRCGLQSPGKGRPEEHDRKVDWVVVTAEPITDVDVTGAQALGELLDELHRRGVTLAFAELKGRVRERLDRFGLVERIGADRFYRTVGEAVRVYVTTSGVAWTDWEDRT